MTLEEFEGILNEKGVLFKFDEVLKLWMVFIDDMTLYLSSDQIEEMSEIEMVIILTKQMIKSVQSGRFSREIIIH